MPGLLLILGTEFAFSPSVHSIFPCAWWLNRTIDLSLRTSFLGRVHDWCYAGIFSFELPPGSWWKFGWQVDTADNYHAAHDFSNSESGTIHLAGHDFRNSGSGTRTLADRHISDLDWGLDLGSAGMDFGTVDLQQMAPAHACQDEDERLPARTPLDRGGLHRKFDAVCDLALPSRCEPDPGYAWILQDHKWWCKQLQMAGPCNCASFYAVKRPRIQTDCDLGRSAVGSFVQDSSHTSSVVSGQDRAVDEVQDPSEGNQDCDSARPLGQLGNETRSRLSSIFPTPGDGLVPSAAHFTGPSGLVFAPVEHPALSHVDVSLNEPVSLTATWIEADPTPFSCAHTVIDPSAFDQLIVDGLDSLQVLDSVNVETPLPAATGLVSSAPSIDRTVERRCSLTLDPTRRGFSAINACDFAVSAITACDGIQDAFAALGSENISALDAVEDPGRSPVSSCASTVIDHSAFEQLIADGQELPGNFISEPAMISLAALDGPECHDLSTGEPVFCALRSPIRGGCETETSAISAGVFHRTLDALPESVERVYPLDVGVQMARHSDDLSAVAPVPGGPLSSLWNEDADLFAAEILHCEALTALDSQAATLVSFHVGVQCLTEWIAFDHKFLEYPEVGRLDTSFSLIFDVGHLNFDVKDITRSPNRWLCDVLARLAGGEVGLFLCGTQVDGECWRGQGVSYAAILLDSVPPGTECLCIHCLRPCDPSGTCPECRSLPLQCAQCSPLPRVGLAHSPVTSPVGHDFADCVIRENSYVDFRRLQAECNSRLVLINFPAKVVCQLSEGWLCSDVDHEERDFLLYLYGFDLSLEPGYKIGLIGACTAGIKGSLPAIFMLACNPRSALVRPWQEDMPPVVLDLFGWHRGLSAFDLPEVFTLSIECSVDAASKHAMNSGAVVHRDPNVPIDLFETPHVLLVSRIEDRRWWRWLAHFPVARLVGSPPCPPWSFAAGGSPKGLDSAEGLLLVHALCFAHLTFCLSGGFENVRTLRRHRHRLVLDKIYRQLFGSCIALFDTDLAVLSGFSRPRLVVLLPRTASGTFDGAEINLPGRGLSQTGALLGLSEASDPCLQPDVGARRVLSDPALLPAQFHHGDAPPSVASEVLRARCILPTSRRVPCLVACYRRQHLLPNLQVKGCLAFLVWDDRLVAGSRVRYLAAFEAARMMGFGVNWLFTDEGQDVLRLGNCFAPLQSAIVWYKIFVGDGITPKQSISQVLFRMLLQGPLAFVLTARSFHIENQLVRRLVLATYLQGEQAVHVSFYLNGDRRFLLGTTSRSSSDSDALLSALPSRHKPLQFSILSASECSAGDGGSRCLEVAFQPVPFQVEPLGFVTIHPFENVGSLQDFVDSQWYGAQGSTRIYAGGRSLDLGVSLLSADADGLLRVRTFAGVGGGMTALQAQLKLEQMCLDQGVPDAPFLVKTFVQRAGMKRVAAILADANIWSAFRTLCTELNIAVSTASTSRSLASQ